MYPAISFDSRHRHKCFGNNNGGVTCDICEYSGVATTDYFDQTSSNYGGGTPYVDSGTTPTTTAAYELWIGCLVNIVYNQSNPTNGFTLMDGNVNNGVTTGFLEKIVSTTGQANVQCTISSGYHWCACIATFKGSTIAVTTNGLYSGAGSKQTTVNYSGANVILEVQANVPSSDFKDSAVIENLVIDGQVNGQIQSGTVGILLQNVYNCTIRNLTILNCDVGIKIENTNGYWSQANRIEHIRMTNVKQGILFTGTTTGTDFGFTIIEDVGIKLTDDSSAVGIQIGTSGGPIVKPYNSFIKATVWLGSTGGYAMRIYGEIKYSLVMLEVEGPGSGTGVDIQTNEDYPVYNNQSFMLSYGNITTTVNQLYYSGDNDIVYKPI